jgi:hypothetical protein
LLDRVCEEFGCLPSAAERELDQNFEVVMDVLFARNYARAKAAYDDTESLKPDARRRLLADPMVRIVRETEFAIVTAGIEESHA